MVPFFAPTVGYAMRSWETSCNDGQSMMSKHPGDYTLFQIADFDESSGAILPLAAHVNLGKALDANRAPEAELPLMRNIRPS
ncbi:VP5 [Kummerowia striata gokushovirus]|nr:VP5 [Kummerowia striata gokushovirus]